jgi:hypothetical protein
MDVEIPSGGTAAPTVVSDPGPIIPSPPPETPENPDDD